MKVAIVTSFSEDTIENTRIVEELGKLGHEARIITLQDFGFQIKNGELEVPGLTDENWDVVIMRGVLNSIKAASTVVKSLRNSGVRVFDNNLFAHLYSIDKVSDILKLSVAGVSLPDTYYARHFGEYLNKAEEYGYPVVVKSVRSGKGVSVYKLDNSDELKSLVERLESEGREPKSYIMQEFVPYEYDLRVLIIGEHMRVMQRIPGEGEFRANFSLGGSVKLHEPDEETKDLAWRALQAVGMSVGGVDVLITADKRRVILEVNHSAGFAGMEEATGENIGKLYVEHVLQAAH